MRYILGGESLMREEIEASMYSERSKGGRKIELENKENKDS